ncbi:hypothetical protein ARMGADRAFT_1061840 [Armillaria gallica]|uniref:Uncharacterized protein n=1 Tax=Armillaria gallica TaxID=47427 RepID=A0A2H3DLX6_ARMGA|nr:hypothetical protein ARMGADRAFT_1061840 [Armillaria gallica]
MASQTEGTNGCNKEQPGSVHRRPCGQRRKKKSVGQEWTSTDKVIEYNIGPTMQGPEGEGGGQSKAIVRLFTPPKSKAAESRMSFSSMPRRGARREYAVAAQRAAKISAQSWATSELVAMPASGWRLKQDASRERFSISSAVVFDFPPLGQSPRYSWPSPPLFPRQRQRRRPQYAHLALPTSQPQPGLHSGMAR